MNRTLLFGLICFSGLIGITLLGDKQPALAGHGCYGCAGSYAVCSCHGCQGCDGHFACHGCYGCSGCYGCQGLATCHGCSGCYGCQGVISCYGCSGCDGQFACHGGVSAAPCYGCAGFGESRPSTEHHTVQDERVSTSSRSVENEPSTATEDLGLASSGLLVLQVPEDAQVIVNNRLTTSRGTVRHLVSRNLQPGTRYEYELRAEVVRDGQMLVRTRHVMLEAGKRANVDFEFEGTGNEKSLADAAAPASITVHVPEDARLFVMGTETQSTGPVRRFVTSRFNPGQRWEEFTIRAEVVRGGDICRLDKTVTLRTGEAREVHFDFEAERFARLANVDAFED